MNKLFQSEENFFLNYIEFSIWSIVRHFFHIFDPLCLGVMGEKEGWNKCVDINLFGVLNGITTVMSRLVYSIILFSKSAKNAVIFYRTPEGAHEVTIINVASILGLFNVQQPKGRDMYLFL